MLRLSTSSIAWWDHDPDDPRDLPPPEELTNAVSTAESSDPGRHALYEDALRRYSSAMYRKWVSSPLRVGGSLADSGLLEKSRGSRGYSINVTRNLCDWGTSLICRSRPKPWFIAENKTFEAVDQAAQRERWVLSGFEQNSVYVAGQRMVKNGAIFGDGYLGVYADPYSKTVKVEHIFTPEIIVDSVEGFNGRPIHTYRKRRVSKYQLACRYKEFRDQILAAGGNSGKNDASDEMIELTEGWSIESYDGAHDGRYMMAIQGETLEYRHYRHPSSPHVRWSWSEDPGGCHGTGIPFEVKSIQTLINMLTRVIESNCWNGASLRIIAAANSVVSAHMNNALKAPIIKFTGAIKPEFQVTDVASPQLIQLLEMSIQHAYRVTGLSELAAQSQTPSAGMSGKARLVHDHTESQRFLEAARRQDEAIARDLTLRYLEQGQELLEMCGDFDVRLGDGEEVERVALSKLVAQRRDFQIQILSTAALSNSAGARLEQIQAYREYGYYSKEQAEKLLDMPNVRSEDDLNLSSVKAVDWAISRIMKGVRKTPIPEMNLTYAVERVQKEILRLYRLRGVPPDRLQMLRDFRDQASYFLEKAANGGPKAQPLGAPADPLAGALPEAGAAGDVGLLAPPPTAGPLPEEALPIAA